MYGLPGNSPLSIQVRELTDFHPHSHNGETVTEHPLLNLLERAVSGDQGDSVGKGGGGASVPINPDAMDLVTRIRHDVVLLARQQISHRQLTPKHIQRLPTATLLQLATRVSVMKDDVALQYNLLQLTAEWIVAIRNLFTPPRTVPLRGATCPLCKNSYVTTYNPENQRCFNPALMVDLAHATPTARCLSCGGEWVGGELVDLGATSELLDSL